MPQNQLSEVFVQLKIMHADQSEGKPLDLLEKLFLYPQDYDGKFSEFLIDLIDTPFWKSQNFLTNAYRNLCLDLGAFVDDHYGLLGHFEPSYHSRKHFQDVCLAMTALLDQGNMLIEKSDKKNEWIISGQESWLLLFCAIAHDFGHNGTANKYPYELEKRSIDLVQEFLDKQPLTLRERKEIIGDIEPIILATDPKYFSTLIDRLNTGRNLDRFNYLSMLMVEADLLASALPNKGKILGERLADEWQLTNPKAAEQVKTNQGRLYFLENIRFISPQSQLLNLESIRQISINQVKDY